MRLHLPHLLAHIRLQIIEGVEMRRLAGNGSHLLRQLRPQFVLFHLEQPAVGVIDDDEFLRVKQMMRDQQRSDRIVRRNPPRIADHVCIARTQSETMLEQNS